MKLRVWWIIDTLLFIVLGFFLFQRFVLQKASLLCQLNSKPTELLTHIEKANPSYSANKNQIIFVSNILPTPSFMETVFKVDKIYHSDVSIHAFIPNLPKDSKQPPYSYSLSKKMIYCDSDVVPANSEQFYMILNNGKISYIDANVEFSKINIMLKQRLKNNTTATIVSAKKLREIVCSKLKCGNVPLEEVGTGIRYTLNGNIKKILFFHTSCSPCAMSSLEYKLKSIEGDAMIIFSILGDSYSIQKLKEKVNIDRPIFIDQEDTFTLASYYGGATENPTIIIPKEGEPI
jgi:hypothetical protein